MLKKILAFLSAHVAIIAARIIDVALASIFRNRGVVAGGVRLGLIFMSGPGCLPGCRAG